MAPEIPGYYFGMALSFSSILAFTLYYFLLTLFAATADPVKKKYFKIEKSHTAPPAAAWSADEVKRRRVASSAAESSRRRARLLRNHIQRHAVLEADLVTRGRLLRELGGGRGEAAVVVEDMMAAAWAGGLVDKGSIPFVPSFARERYANMPCMYVGGDDDKTGLGVAYASASPSHSLLFGAASGFEFTDRGFSFSQLQRWMRRLLWGATLPRITTTRTLHSQEDGRVCVVCVLSGRTDDGVRISFSRTAPESTGRRQGLRAEMIRCPQMSSIRYHRPSHKILLTSREPDHSCGLYFFSPLLSEEHDYRPQWLLGESTSPPPPSYLLPSAMLITRERTSKPLPAAVHPAPAPRRVARPPVHPGARVLGPPLRHRHQRGHPARALQRDHGLDLLRPVLRRCHRRRSSSNGEQARPAGGL